MVKLVTVAFNTNHVQEMVAFYLAVGAKLEPKQVKGGSVSYQGSLGQMNLTIYGVSKGEGSASPNFSMKLEVENLSQIMNALADIQKIEIIMDQESLPEGRLSIIVDPEGHSIELIEPWRA